MTSKILDEWFTEHFLMYAPPVRPLLLLMDGHSSHYSPCFIEAAAENEVIVFCLPPNTTHFLQPLDNGPFGPMKTYWREECHSFSSSNPLRVVTKMQFNRLFHRAWVRGMSMTNIAAGFQHTGVYPLKRPEPKVDASTYDPSSLAKRTGIKYIPMYTPSKRPVKPYQLKTPKFSIDEISRYQSTFELQYSSSDPQYRAWLSMYHPSEAVSGLGCCECVFVCRLHMVQCRHLCLYVLES